MRTHHREAKNLMKVGKSSKWISVFLMLMMLVSHLNTMAVGAGKCSSFRTDGIFPCFQRQLPDLKRGLCLKYPVSGQWCLTGRPGKQRRRSRLSNYSSRRLVSIVIDYFLGTYLQSEFGESSVQILNSNPYSLNYLSRYVRI